MRLRSLVPLCLLVLSGAPAMARAATPTLAAQIDTVRNVDSFTWSVPLTLRNPLETGLYVDSLVLEARDLDPGETGGPKQSVSSLDMLVRVMQGVAPGDSLMFDYSGPASAEYADLTFRMRVHDAHGKSYSFATTVPARGGVLTDAYPSEFVQAAGNRIEIVRLAPIGASDPVPGLLLVHGRNSSARKLLPQGLRLASPRFGVVAVSLPGYGQSTGKADPNDAAAVAALAAALEAVKLLSGVDSTRLAVWGIDAGAGAAARFAAPRSDLSALILQSGIYGKPEAIRTPVLLLHAEKDAHAPASAAHALDATVKAAGGSVEAYFAPGEYVPPVTVQSHTRDFLKRRVGSR